MKLIIAGGRDFYPEGNLRKQAITWLDELNLFYGITEVHHGGAKGADSFGAEWAAFRGIKAIEHKPEWALLGRIAGPVRNGEMAIAADALALFPGGKGTANMLRQATEHGLEIFSFTTRAKT